MKASLGSRHVCREYAEARLHGRNERLVRDSDLRAALLHRLSRRYSHEPDTLVMEEIGLRHGAARIDVIVVNGLLHGYELKSDSDSLKRLARQESIYSSVLDRVTLIVGRRHAKVAAEMVPDWWGVQVAEMGPRGGVLFSSARRGRKNPSQDAVAVAKLLWRDEALELLRQLGAARGFTSKPRAAIYSRLAEVASAEVIRARVLERFKDRIDWRSAAQ